MARATRIGTFLARVTRKAPFAWNVVPKHVKPAVVDVGLARQAYLVPSKAALSKMNAVRCAVSISVAPFAVEKDVQPAVTTGVVAAVTTVRVASLRSSQRRMLSK